VCYLTEWLDLRTVTAGEPCVTCGTALEIIRCIEAGHIFKLGRKYAEAMGMSVLDENGDKRVPIMGSYGIGVGRAMAAIIETHHDDNGVIWPVAVAPFEVSVILVSLRDDDTVAAGEDLYTQLRQRGIDVVLDDRDARAGVKFADPGRCEVCRHRTHRYSVAYHRWPKGCRCRHGRAHVARNR